MTDFRKSELFDQLNYANDEFYIPSEHLAVDAVILLFKESYHQTLQNALV
jgi:hypothetical protein